MTATATPTASQIRARLALATAAVDKSEKLAASVYRIRDEKAKWTRYRNMAREKAEAAEAQAARFARFNSSADQAEAQRHNADAERHRSEEARFASILEFDDYPGQERRALEAADAWLRWAVALAAGVYPTDLPDSFASAHRGLLSQLDGTWDA